VSRESEQWILLDRNLLASAKWSVLPLPALIAEPAEEVPEPAEKVPTLVEEVAEPARQPAPKPAAPRRKKRVARPRRVRRPRRVTLIALAAVATTLLAGGLGAGVILVLWPDTGSAEGPPRLPERPEKPGASTEAVVVVASNGEHYDCTIVGTPRRDVLEGTEAGDVLCGRGGDDVIEGKGGADVLLGGSGDDVLVGGPGSDRLDGDTGADALRARDGWSDRLDGGSGRDRADAGRLDRATRVESRSDPVIVAAGDIACDPLAQTFNGGFGTPTRCRQKYTAQLVETLEPDAVLVLGDIQYEDGALWKYARSYAPTWGRFKMISHPTPGTSHDRFGRGGYPHYWGARAGRGDAFRYSLDIGDWHIVSLNSNCKRIGSCDAGSPEELWLRADLAAHPTRCTLAFWHEPRFSSSGKDAPKMNGVWRTLTAFGAELVLSADAHNYERFRPQDVDGNPDARGMRQFIVGTGGKSLQRFTKRSPGSKVRNWTTFGVLKLTLHARSYDWRFVPEPGGSFIDAGSSGCH
jgi:acid phosphatase type 7